MRLPALAGGLRLRDVQASDGPVLEHIYRDVRTAELTLLPMADEQKAAFVRAQLAAQDRRHRSVHPCGRFLVLEREGEVVGRLSLALVDDDLRILDIALLAAHRGLGIGTAVLVAVLELADEEGRRLVLHVEHGNPARRLYERLGFQEAGSTELHARLERAPSTIAVS